MKIMDFYEFLYGTLFGDDPFRYTRVSNTPNGFTIGVRDWTGYTAITILQAIVHKLGFIKSSWILGFKLRHNIMNPYSDWNAVRYNIDLDDEEIERISRLLSTKKGSYIQDEQIGAELSLYVDKILDDNIRNVGVAAFMITQYLNWVPNVSDEIIAICRTHGKGTGVTLLDIRDKFDHIIDNENTDKGIVVLFYKILVHMCSDENIF